MMRMIHHRDVEPCPVDKLELFEICESVGDRLEYELTVSPYSVADVVVD